MKIFVMTIVLLLGLTVSASAQQIMCYPYDEFRTQLQEKHGETLAVTGKSMVHGPNGVDQVEIYINPETKKMSYLFAMTHPERGKELCVGDYLENLEFILPQSYDKPPEPTTKPEPLGEKL